MEKLRITGKKQFRNRLLAFLVFLSGPFGFAITSKQIGEITIIPQDNVFFTNQELKYTLTIPEVEPSDVVTQLDTLPEGITFVSSRRMEYFENEDLSGTRIEFWFTFRETGNKVIPPLSVTVKGWRYKIPFEPVELYENPNTIAPRMILEIKDKKLVSNAEYKGKDKNEITVSAHESLEFMLYVQYTTGIKNFGYEIPKDSVFEETKRYFSKDNQHFDTEFTQKLSPVASFRWTLLKPGKYSLPDIRMIASAYSGRNVEISLPECIINCEPQVAQDSQPANDSNVFTYAFTQLPVEHKPSDVCTITQADIAVITNLRIKERHSLFGLYKIRKLRSSAEKRVGVSVSENEPNIAHVFIYVVVFVLLALCTIMLLLFRKKVMATVFIALAIPSAALALLGSIAVFKTYGIVTGGAISPVPEDSALTSTNVTLGTRVEIVERTEKWFYIQYDNNGGWIKRENILVIK